MDLRKSTTLAGLVLVFAGTVVGQPTERNVFGLFGNVKRVDEKQVKVEIVNGIRKETSSEFEETTVFDDKGRLEYERYGGATTVERRHVYADNGRRRTIADTKAPFEKPNAYKRPSISGALFSYNATENSISHDTVSGRDFGGPTVTLNEYGQRYKYYFDKTNRLIKKVIMDSGLREVTTYQYTYADSGPPSEAKLYLRGKLLQTLLYKYILDPQGNWTRRETQSIPTNPEHPITFEVSYRKISYYKN